MAALVTDRLSEIEARANAAGERHEDCDMGDDGGPCEQCLAIRQFEARVRELETRDDWLAKQLDGLIEDAEAVAHTTGLALARSVVGNLRDAREALAPAEQEGKR